MDNLLSAVLITTHHLFGGDGAFGTLIQLVIYGSVLGLIYYGVSLAPFIPAVFKQVLLWLIICFGIILIINVLLSLIGHPLFEI